MQFCLKMSYCRLKYDWRKFCNWRNFAPLLEKRMCVRAVTVVEICIVEDDKCTAVSGVVELLMAAMRCGGYFNVTPTTGRMRGSSPQAQPTTVQVAKQKRFYQKVMLCVCGISNGQLISLSFFKVAQWTQNFTVNNWIGALTPLSRFVVIQQPWSIESMRLCHMTMSHRHALLISSTQKSMSCPAELNFILTKHIALTLRRHPTTITPSAPWLTFFAFATGL